MQPWEVATNENWLSTRCYDKGEWQTVVKGQLPQVTPMEQLENVNKNRMTIN